MKRLEDCMELLSYLRTILRAKYYYVIHNKEWRKKNSHNNTFIKYVDEFHEFPMNKVRVGRYTYGHLAVLSFKNDSERLIIGDFCSIPSDACFILGGGHDYTHFSTFPFSFYSAQELNAYTNGPIILEDDVWLGSRAIVMSGVRLARGTVVAAGSVVTKSTEPYSIVGGNPAGLIKKRFSDTVIEKLMKVDMSKMDMEIYLQYRKLFDHSLDESSVEKIIDILSN